MNVDGARHVLEDAVEAGVFPAATVEVGSSAGAMWADALGTRTFDDARPILLDNNFDLASLTKVIATTTVAMELVRSGALNLDRAIARSFPDWRGEDRGDVTVRDLLEHASGLPARLLDAPPSGRREFEYDICRLPLEYAPRTTSIYSDLGFILLGFLVADLGAASLNTQFATLMAGLRPPKDGLGFGPVDDAAPTIPIDEDTRRGRLLVGEVHDSYAAALSGVAGHAGLFGTAAGVGAFARTTLGAARGDAGLSRPWTPELVTLFTKRSAVAGSSRALGWDLMVPTSSCGTRMSHRAFGHVGFTGTSLWIDPERDRYVVLLTNRACGGGTLDQMRHVRRAFHDALS